MAGLNDLISNTAQQTTTLPTWFDTAQQNVVNQAGQAAANAPQPQNTVAQNAVNQLSGPTNAFTTAQGTLQNIASGAANPWITNPTTGQVTPDTSTAMGGLFQAQNQQLNQMMPNVTAPADAGAIGAGQFGSLRGQTAHDKAIGDAIAQMNTAQNQAALTNQATGVNAAQGVGNVAQQGINNLLTTGQYQQAAPFTNASNYGKVLGGIQAPTSVSNQTQLSPLNQMMGMVSALGGSSGTGGLLGSLGVTGGLTGLINQAKGLFGPTGSGATQSGSPSIGGGTTPGTYPTADGGTMLINSDGSKTITAADGTPQYFDAQGNPVSSDQGLQNANIIPDSGLTQQSPSAGDTSSIDNVDYSQYQ